MSCEFGHGWSGHWSAVIQLPRQSIHSRDSRWSLGEVHGQEKDLSVVLNEKLLEASFAGQWHINNDEVFLGIRGGKCCSALNLEFYSFFCNLNFIFFENKVILLEYKYQLSDSSWWNWPLFSMRLVQPRKESNPLKAKLMGAWGSWDRNKFIHAATRLQQEGTS